MYPVIGSNGFGYSIYFILIVVIGSYILLNLFVAILVEQFDKEDDDEDDLDDSQNEVCDNEEQEIIREKKKQNTKQRRKEKLMKQLEQRPVDPIELNGNSYFFFGPTNKIRVFFKFLILHPYFDSLIYSIIGLSCIVLALDEPVKLPMTERFLNIVSNLVLALFTLEFIIKTIVLGFVKGKRSYIKNSWNLLDFFIIIVSYLDIILTNAGGSFINLSFIRAFRALRALRPLRMVTHNERMKKVVTSVIQAVPAVIDVTLITLLFYIIFGILGIIFFKGVMFYCTDSNILLENECVGNFVDSAGNIVERQ